MPPRNHSVPETLNELFPGGHAGALGEERAAEVHPLAIPGVNESARIKGANDLHAIRTR
jgi:hypothetical protein